MSPPIEPPAARTVRAIGAIASSAAAETANVAALSANAQPTPTPSISRPPIAGPASRSAIGRTN